MAKNFLRETNFAISFYSSLRSTSLNAVENGNDVMDTSL